MMRCAEFFSGIGGMHYALKRSGVSAEVVAAFDINSVANACYEHNFPEVTVTRVNVEHLAVEHFERLAADAWLMSPPCQPFTRGGKNLDDEDARSRGFIHLTEMLGRMHNPPQFLFVENVLNFETSQCHARFLATIRQRNYQTFEFLVMPSDSCVGIPNDRLRYYLAAVRRSTPVAPEAHIFRSFGEFFTKHPELQGSLASGNPDGQIRTIGEYLRGEEEDNVRFAVPLKYLTDYKNYRHDIVNCQSRRSTTFTKAYGSKHIIGTGSFLQTRHVGLDYQPDDTVVLPTLGLRFFSPREIALLHAFPIESGTFQFPAVITEAQQYRLLGNSLNVHVVAIILDILFSAANK